MNKLRHYSLTRFWTLGLLALLVGCGRMNNGTLPSSMQMGYDGIGSLTLYAANGAAWRVDVNSVWLEVSPRRGFGTARLSLKTDPSLLPEGIPLESQLQFTGDIKGKVKVIQPLMRLRGRIEGATPVQAAAQAPSLPLNARTSGLSSSEIVVEFKGQPTVPAGAELKTFDPFSGWAVLRVKNPQLVLDQIRSLPGVRRAERNGKVSIQATSEPTDQFYPRQWYLRATGARYSYLGDYPNPVTVAVIDTGVRYDHPDLQGRLWTGAEGAFDFVNSDSDPTDPNDTTSLEARKAGSHGTHVTGIITARAGTFTPPCPDCTDSGIAGLAHPAPIKVLPLRVLDESGSGDFPVVAAAIRYAAGIAVGWNDQTLNNPNPAQIINLSLGSTNPSMVLCDAVADAVAKGVVVVAASGNYQNQSPGVYVYPAACAGAVGVAATDADGKPTFYSQQNDRVTLAAPGGDTRKSDEAGDPLGILSTTYNFETRTPNYAYLMGTSQAAPQVAAAIALVLSSGKVSTPDAAVAAIKAKLTDLGSVGKDPAYGLGFLNLPAIFGFSLPAGKVVGQLIGPIPQRLIPDAAGWFEAKVLAGRYRVQLCRDDSANALCDSGELNEVRDLNLTPRATYDVGVLRLNIQ